MTMKKVVESDLKKIEILQSLMPKFKDYRLDEEYYHYDIVPNRFKGNTRRSFLRVHKKTENVFFMGSNLADKLYMVSLLDYIPVDNNYILELLDIIYTSADKYKMYNSKKNKSHIKNILNRLNNKKKLDLESNFTTHFDIIGQLSSKKQRDNLKMTRQYTFTDDYQLTEVYYFSVPIPSYKNNLTNLYIDIRWLSGVLTTSCHITRQINDETITISHSFNNLSELKVIMDNEFSFYYKAVIKQDLDIITDKVDESHVTLLRMMVI
jgi:hypothetical protein